MEEGVGLTPSEVKIGRCYEPEYSGFVKLHGDLPHSRHSSFCFRICSGDVGRKLQPYDKIFLSKPLCIRTCCNLPLSHTCHLIHFPHDGRL